MVDKKQSPNTKEVTTWETDWDLDELKFETPNGTAVYKYAGLVPYVKEIRQTTKTMRGTPTWETAGYEEVERDGHCAMCNRRVFVCESHPITAEEEIGERIVAWKKTGAHEPPLAYCQRCIKEDPDVKMQLDEQVRVDNYMPTEYERFLEAQTAALGGKV
jgi:hypothetical protein